MRIRGTISLVIILLASAMGAVAQSVLQSGAWFKVAVEKSGVYKITYDQLRQMGFNPTSVDPRNIRIYGNEGGMLPQSNAAERPVDLVEIAIVVPGESDGVLNSGDYILFYAHGADAVRYDVTRNIFAYENNLYSERNYYFVTVGTQPGKRMDTEADLADGAPAVTTFTDYIFHELDEQNILDSGREWFGERFDAILQQRFAHAVPGIVPSTDIQLVSSVMAQSETPSTFKININGVAVHEHAMGTIPDTQYGAKGQEDCDTITVGEAAVSASVGNLNIDYQYVRPGKGTGYLNFFLVSFERTLALYGNQTTVWSPQSMENTTSTMRVAGVSAGVQVWDVSDPYDARIQAHTLQGNMVSFSTPTDVLKTWVVFDTNIPSPELVGAVPNQNLRGMTTPGLIIVAHPDFVPEAQRLAQHRQTHDGWTTAVVTPEKVYNEFASGRQDVTAIRDFIKMLYDNDAGALRAVLLFGKGSYDYKDRVTANTNFVPTYESRNSLLPLESYSSDDYYGFLEPGEGRWSEGNSAEEHTLDVGVGRLPVRTLQEAQAVVDKIIDYDTNRKKTGRWRKRITFVADDGNSVDGWTEVHQSQANTMANNIEAQHPGFDTKKMFLGTYVKTIRPSGDLIPEANRDILNTLDRGTVLVNYTGHGSARVWADERVFTNFDVEELDNKLLPFLVTATCAFGRHDDPLTISTAELCVLRPNAGAIGMVTTARDVYSSSNFQLNKAFYEALFAQTDNRYHHLAEIFRHTKNNSISGVGNRNFSLLADPSQTLALPSQSVVITSIETAAGSDTLKALSRVMVTGELQNATGDRLTGFDGTVEATLYDKQTDYITIGMNNPPLGFRQWDNILFQGKASVKEGVFSFEFVLTKNLAYEVAPGKLSLYAATRDGDLDAAGSTSSFKMGGSEKNPGEDVTPPVVRAYMGDTTFVNGGLVSANSTLVVRVADASGINISNYGIGTSMTATLDNDGEVFLLSDFYQSDTDDFTKGWVHYPLTGLAPGRHSITVRVWDSYNNPAQSQVDFIVSDGTYLLIEDFGNYPNPFVGGTTLYFTHNRAGDDLDGQVAVYDLAGKMLKTYSFETIASPYRVELGELAGLDDVGKYLAPGVYLVRITVRSLTNGSKNERVTKLIAVN